MRSKIGKMIKISGAVLFYFGAAFIILGLITGFYQGGFAQLGHLLDFTDVRTLITFAIALLPGYALYRIGCMIAGCQRKKEQEA